MSVRARYKIQEWETLEKHFRSLLLSFSFSFSFSFRFPRRRPTDWDFFWVAGSHLFPFLPSLQRGRFTGGREGCAKLELLLQIQSLRGEGVDMLEEFFD